MTDFFDDINQELGNTAPVQKKPRARKAEFPDIPANFDKAAPIPAPQAQTKAFDRSERLETLVDDALAKAQELLDIPLIPGDGDFVKVASMQKDLVVSLVNTGVKVDENRFKKRQGDALTGILAQLLEREQKLGPLLEMPTSGPPN